MTIAGGDARQGWFDWYSEWAGHHAYIYWLYLTFNPLTRLFGEYASRIDFVVFGWALVTMIIGFRHDAKTLCLRCIRVAPLDPQREITRYDRRLRVIHGNTAKRSLIGAVVWVAGFIGFFSLLKWAFPGPEIVPLWAILLVNVIVFSPLVYMNMCGQWHQWLRPWCPYCRRWDEGGSPEVVPDPVPSGEGDKVS